MTSGALAFDWAARHPERVSVRTGWCAGHIAALEIVSCGHAGHHAPEDRPREIASAIAAWVDRHQLRDEHHR